MTYNRRSRTYGGENPPPGWGAPDPEALGAIARGLHRPHAPVTTTTRARAVARRDGGYLAPTRDLITYRRCRICGDAWPCPHADRCVVDDQPWPCDTADTDTEEPA